MLVEHGGVVNLLVRSAPLFSATSIGENPRCGISLNYIFDAFQQAFFSPLAVHGGTCIMLESGLALMTLEKDANIDVLYDVPSVMALSSIPRGTKLVQVIGEALTSAVVHVAGCDALVP